MTKYILHGGSTRAINPDNESFFREMTLGLEGKIKILLVYFAVSDEEAEEFAPKDKERFLANSDNKDLEFEVARVEGFAQQVKNSDVIYLRGGDTEQLMEKLKQNPDLKSLFEGKVVGGSSAGAYALCKYYWTHDGLKVGEGLGIFDIKCYCHYVPEGTDILEALRLYKEELPILTLPDYKWVVVYK